MTKKEILRLAFSNGTPQNDNNAGCRKRKYNFNGAQIFRVIEKSIDANTKTIISFFLLFLAADIAMLHITGDNHHIAAAFEHINNAVECLVACDLGTGMIDAGGGISL